jgi:hypothetical protein
VRRTTSRALGTALAFALAAGGLAGCSGDDEPEPAPSSTPAETGARVETTARLGEIVGRLPKPQRQRALTSVTAVVDGWMDAAYVEGDYPRTDFAEAFPGFTRGAAALATKQAATLSNAGVGKRVETVDVLQRRVSVDLLSARGRPVGATARVVLVIDLTGDVERRDRIRGRVVLTPAKGSTHGWRVFAFDVARDQVRSKR